MDYIMQIIGKRLGAIGRASSICWIGFGELVNETLYNGETRQIEEFGLNLQCPWRLVDADKSRIILASADMFEPLPNIEWTPEFNWDIQGGNLFDYKMRNIQSRLLDSIVESVHLNEFNDLKITFSNELIFECFINLTSSTECWRFIQTGNDVHAVITGEKIILQ